MSKPLVFVLQLIALGFIVSSIFSDPIDYVNIIIGVGLAVISGHALRQRLKADRGKG